MLNLRIILHEMELDFLLKIIKYAAWAMRFSLLAILILFQHSKDLKDKKNKTSFVYISLFQYMYKEMIFFVLLLCFLLQISYIVYFLFFFFETHFFYYSVIFEYNLLWSPEKWNEKKKNRKEIGKISQKPRKLI